MKKETDPFAPKKEKHHWVKHKEYLIDISGDYHYVFEYEVCDKCEAVK